MARASGSRILVNEAAKIERSEFLGVKPYERTAKRRDYANGFKPRLCNPFSVNFRSGCHDAEVIG
ncbi:MAG: hypothetical protein KatS3mg123_3298 [Burkholderiales bacterium]|nr:MAG: hypothetical protein KatS3mg123_3298 [Burkholderiales bacterium]